MFDMRSNKFQNHYSNNRIRLSQLKLLHRAYVSSKRPGPPVNLFKLYVMFQGVRGGDGALAAGKRKRAHRTHFRVHA